MVVAVASVTAMDVASDDIVDVSRVRHDVVSAINAVHVIGRMAAARVPG